MRGSYLDREAVEAEIDRVRSLGFDELRALWRTTLRPSPPSDAVSVTCFRELGKPTLPPLSSKQRDPSFSVTDKQREFAMRPSARLWRTA